MFGRRRRELQKEISALRLELATLRGDIECQSERLSQLRTDAIRVTLATATAPSILVGDKSVSLPHAVQVLADAHDMQAVERHLRIKHHRQGDVQGRAINEW
jgi:uncharacterized protein YlxW (UPF0749 family)